MDGDKIDSTPAEKTTVKKPSPIRVKEHLRWLLQKASVLIKSTSVNSIKHMKKVFLCFCINDSEILYNNFP